MSRTNIVIDDKLITEGLKLSGLKTKKDLVDAALREFVRKGAQKKLQSLFGKVDWDGDLSQLRRKRAFR